MTGLEHSFLQRLLDKVMIIIIMIIIMWKLEIRRSWFCIPVCAF